MATIQHKFLIKFLALFIKTSDLNQEQDKTLLDALKIIKEHKPVIED